MKYSRGDVVKFKLQSGEIEEGDVQFVEKRSNGEILYVNSFSSWAYKVPEKRVLRRVPARK